MNPIKLSAGKESGARVGIDIGSRFIKIIQVSGSAEKPVLSGIGHKDIAGLPATEIPDSLKILADSSNISGKDASISVSGSAVIVRFISLPRMDDNALRGAIRYEAEKFIPYNINDCIIDFQTLAKDGKDNKLNVLLVAAKKEIILQRIGIAEKAGFNIKVVDVDAFAVTNAFLRNKPNTDAGKSFALLNIGSTYTNLSIMKGSLIYFARDIALGGNDLNLTDLLDEVKLSFGYYENQAGKGIDEIYVSGGGALAAGLEQAFEEALGSKPSLWDPLAFLDVAGLKGQAPLSAETKGLYSVVAGLVAR